MGFIENLRRKKAVEAEALKNAQANAERERLASLGKARDQRDQRELEKKIREASWQKAKAHFEQSGVRGMLKELIGIKAATSTFETRNCNENIGRSYEGDFCISLNIEETARMKSSVDIRISADGRITFEGEREIGIPKTEWESNRGILEETLGTVYRKPRIDCKPEHYDYSQPRGGG